MKVPNRKERTYWIAVIAAVLLAAVVYYLTGAFPELSLIKFYCAGILSAGFFWWFVRFYQSKPRPRGSSSNSRLQAVLQSSRQDPGVESPHKQRWKPPIFFTFWRALVSIDARALGVFRIFYGSLFIFDIYRRLPYLELMYTAEGILPNKTIHNHPFSPALFSVLNSFDGSIEVTIFFYVGIVLSFLFAIGYRTKLFQILASIFILSIHNKNILVENGGDQVMNLFVVWMLFLPMGVRYSVDSLRKSLRSRETCARELNDRSLGADPRVRVWSLAILACLCQLAVIYFFNAVEKNGPTWRDGDAMYYIMQMDRQITGFAFWARHNLPYGAWVGMDYTTFALEGLSALLILSPIFITGCRRLAFLMLVSLHIGIIAIMNVGAFSPAMFCAYPILMTAPDFDLWKRWLRKCSGGAVVVFYDPDCGFCMWCMRILKRIDCLELLTFADRSWTGNTPPDIETLRTKTIVVWKEGNQESWTRNKALGRICLSLPFGFLYAWPFFLPGIGFLLGWLYDGIATRRTKVSTFFGEPACTLNTAPAADNSTTTPSQRSDSRLMFGQLGWGVKELAVFLLILFNSKQMLSSNKYITQITQHWESGSFRQEAWIRNFLRYPRNFQKWNMFAPNPPRGEGWVVVDACTVGGDNIDPFTGKEPLFGPVDHEHGFDFGQHWRIYSKRIAKKKHRSRREALRNYLVQRHRFLDLVKEDRLAEFDVYWMYYRSPSPNEWYKPLPAEHWLPKLGETLGGQIWRDRLASWGRMAPRFRTDTELFAHTEYLKGNRKVRPTCYKITSHHPRGGKMRCKNGKKGPPKHCKKSQPTGARKSKSSKKRKKGGSKKTPSRMRPGPSKAKKTITPAKPQRLPTLPSLQSIPSPR